jgi:hypothetical protein
VDASFSAASSAGQTSFHGCPRIFTRLDFLAILISSHLDFFASDAWAQFASLVIG